MSNKKERVTITISPISKKYIDKVRCDNSFSSTIDKMIKKNLKENFIKEFLECFDDPDKPNYINFDKAVKLKNKILEN